ncbi:MAG: tetratricopeptide repeat protein [Theionarchaea archaeon]|nr:tetratricopeptide repeat protein [Theionarchaea archaeon]
MKIEKVVEEFLKLLSQEKVEQAEELIVGEAKGVEDDVAENLLMIGAEIGDEGYHFEALCCFEAAGKVVKSEDLKRVIIQNLAIAHNNYGNLLQDMGKYEEAESHYKESLRINPEYAEAHNNYGNLLKEMGKYEEAEFHYKESLRINPEYAEAHNNYGNLLKEMGKYEEAEFHYKESLRINPEYAQAHNNYGNLLKEMGKYEEAEFHYKESLRINPEYAQAHYNYGNLLKEMGKYEEAEFHYKESLRINPEYAQAHINYGNLLKEMGKYEEAEFHYKESLRINPEDAQAHNNYGVLLKEMGKYEEAAFHYKESLRINPEYASANANLGILYFTTGALERAVQWLRKASHLFKKEGKRIDSIRMNGLADWALARKFWENFSSSKKETYGNLEESRKYYLEAAAKLEDMGVPELYPFFEFISNAIFIGKDFLLSLDSENLKELQIRVAEVYTKFLPVYQNITEISFPDIDLLNAQFTCIETLTKCLNYEDIDHAPIHTAIDIFSRYRFSEPLQASTALINFIDEFSKCRKEYRCLEEIPEDKQKELLRMVKPFSALDSITTRKIDQLTSEKYATPFTEELRKVVREELRESEIRVLSGVELLFEKHHHELLEKIDALNSTQVEELKNAISKIIEEKIENIKDPNEKEKNKNEYNKWKKTFKAASTALQIAGSVASIYTLFAGGRPEEAVNGISTVISIALSKIERI